MSPSTITKTTPKPSKIHVVSTLPSPNTVESPAISILGSLATHYCKPITTTNSNDEKGGVDEFTTTFTNNYFNATVCLSDMTKLVNGDTASSGKNGGTNNQKNNQVAEEVEGLIVVYTPSTFPETFKLVGKLFGEDGEYSMWGNELKLMVCVVTTEEEETSYQSYIQRLNERGEEDIGGNDAKEDVINPFTFCLENGYEFNISRVDEAGCKLGFGEREKEGFSRIVESLEMGVWNSKIEKGKEVAQPPKEKEIDGLPTPPNNTETSSNNNETTTINMPPNPASSDLLKSLMSESSSSPGNEKNAEKQMENLEKLLANVSQIRNKSIGAGFSSDTERKVAAGEAAMKLMECLMMGDDEDDSSDEELGDFSSYLKNKAEAEGLGKDSCEGGI